MNHYATEAYAVGVHGTEIGGLARVQVEDTDVYVVDIHMFPQRASGASFDIHADDINEFTLMLLKDGRTEEIPEWCSIVHSHPIGMGAQMSGVDVDAIKRFAAEEDAFSLIISTSKDADSVNLLMHYCTNIRGTKHIINNMPVNKCYSEERLTMGKEIADFIMDKLDIDFTEGDRKMLLQKCATFTANTLPDMFEAELDELKAFVKEDVRALIKSTNTGYGYSRELNNASSAYDGWSQREDGTWVKDYSGSSSTSSSSGSQDPLWDDADYYAGGYEWFDGDQEELEKHRDLILTANGVDPKTGNNDVSKNQQKKAKRRLRKIAERARSRQGVVEEKTLAQTDRIVNVDDYVIVLEDASEGVRAQCIDDDEWALAQSLMMVPGQVRHIKGETINVNGLDFWSEELRFATQDEISLARQLDTVV